MTEGLQYGFFFFCPFRKQTAEIHEALAGVHPLNERDNVVTARGRV